MSARGNWPALTIVNDRQGAKNIAHNIRQEIKRVRAKVRAALVALRARRKEARAEHRARELEARAELKRRIAELRAESKQASADRKQALREVLAAIDAEIAASRAELADLLPDAKNYLRALMTRGENLKSAAAIARGRKSMRKRTETLAELRDLIVDEMEIARFKGGVAEKARNYIMAWLRRPKKKGQAKLDGYNQFDPTSKYWSPLEQFQHWAAEDNHWQDMINQWGEEESEYELDHAEKSWKRLDLAVVKAAQLLEDAAQCSDPEAYQALEDAITGASEINSYDGKNLESLAEKIEELSEELTEECAARDTDTPFDWEDPKAGKLRAGSIRRMRSKLRQKQRKTLETRPPSKPRRVSSATATKPFGAPSQRATNPFKAKLRRGQRKKPEPKPKAPARKAGRADHGERQQARVASLTARAEKKAAAAEAKRAQASAIGQRFEFGQPIIMGHHSTKRALRDREKMDDATRAAVREQEEAERLLRRVAAAESNKAISSDDPQAAAKLAERIDGAEAHLALIAIVRNVVKRTKTPEARAEELMKLGLTPKNDLVRFAMADPMTRAFPDKLSAFIATNSNANLRRLRERLKGLQHLATVKELATEYTGNSTLSEEDNRIALRFRRKPDREGVAELKAAGFKWSPKAVAWIRKLTPANRDTVIAKARTVAKALERKPLNVELVQEAYFQLKQENGLRNQRVFEIAKRADLSPADVHAALHSLHEQNMVNPTYGELNAVSQAERAAAWRLGGQLFLMVELGDFGGKPRNPAPAKPRKLRSKRPRATNPFKAKLRRGPRKAPPKAKAKAPIPVLIEFGAEMNRNAEASGWIPQLWVDGYPKLGTWSRKGYEVARALEAAKYEADQEQAEWGDEYRTTVALRVPESRPTLKPNAPKATPAPRVPRQVGTGWLLDDERVIVATHQRLDTRNDNMTLLFDLRKETRIPRARFDAAIQSLRKQGRAYLESSQGQAVKLTAPQRAAGIEEEGRRLVYFSLR